MNENLSNLASKAWGLLVGVVALIFFGCIFINVTLGLLSLGLWLLPLPLAFGASVALHKQVLQRERVFYAILSVGAMLCFPWASLVQNYGPSLPTWLQIILTHGFSSEPVQGPRGPEIHDVSTVMGSAAVVSVIGALCFVVGAYSVVKERFGPNKTDEPPDPSESE